MYQIARYVDVNINGTAILLDILSNDSHSIKKLIVASSRAIYGEGKYRCNNCEQFIYPNAREENNMLKGDYDVKCPHCNSNVLLALTDESSKIHPTSIYGITKQNQEQMVLTIAKSLGISAISFRYQNVYGPGQSLSNPYTGILSIFSTRIRNHKEILIFEDGLESRDFVYIDDVVNATIAGIESHKISQQYYNVGSGIGTDVLTVARTLAKAYGIDVPITITGNFRLGDIRHNIADISRIKQELGFIPSVHFRDGIASFSKWVLSQELAQDGYDNSIYEMKLKGLFK